MSKINAFLKTAVGKKERIICTTVLIVFVLLALLGDSIEYFGIDSCYRGFFPDISEKYVRSCENSIREQCGTKFGLDVLCVEYVKTHIPLNVLIGRIFLLADTAMLLVMFSKYRLTAIIAGLALTLNLSMIIAKLLHFAQPFFSPLSRPFSITLIIALYFYLFLFILRERLESRDSL